MAESLPMMGGNGHYSYAKNSQFQKQALDSAKGMFTESILEIDDINTLLSPSNTLTLADFGCSVGPNTFFAMQNLIEAVEAKWPSHEMEFQVFFNDHAANDFNTLFATLPPRRKYHAAGVPGSFHARLFPRGSIGLALSSYAVHWLSRVPSGMKNKGKIHYHGASEEVVNAYRGQFGKDVEAFLSARAEEIVKGGLLFLVVPATPNVFGVFNVLSESSLLDLANEGVIDESEMEGFNIPIYYPRGEDMRREIEKNGSFSIVRMEERIQMAEVNSESMMMHLRASGEATFSKHFEISVVDKMFIKTFQKAQEFSHPISSTELFLVLKRC